MKLDTEQLSLLQRAVDTFEPQLAPLVSADAVSLPLEKRNELRSAITSLLVSVGFDEAYEPTELGLQLEALIDVLGPK